MTQTPTQGPVVEVKAQPTVYTVLLLVAIFALAIAIGVVMYHLTADTAAGGYGLTVGEIFGGGSGK